MLYNEILFKETQKENAQFLKMIENCEKEAIVSIYLNGAILDTGIIYYDCKTGNFFYSSGSVKQFENEKYNSLINDMKIMYKCLKIYKKK